MRLPSRVTLTSPFVSFSSSASRTFSDFVLVSSTIVPYDSIP